jgi:hypothetical protein
MSNRPIFTSHATRPDPVPRILAAAALGVSILALVFSMVGFAPASGGGPAAKHPVTAQTKAAQIKRESKKRKREAREKSAELNERINSLKLSCPISGAIDMGSYCLEGTTFKVPSNETGQNDYLYATQKCVAEGGWLPTAAQLIGAAPKVSLKSTVDDSPATSATSEFPEARSGIKDEREMTSDLFTTTAGSRAAGSEGITEGSKGTGNLGEPNPVPIPAEPLPETLDYVTVYDNHDTGGFAGGVPVGKPEPFRCAYAKGQGKARDISSRS